MATDEEVEQQRKAVVELRAKLDDARTSGVDKQRELDNDITLSQLRAEEARLQAELATVKENNKVTVLRAGAEPVLSTVKEQMAAAVDHQKAVAAEIAANRPTRTTSTPQSADADNSATAKQAENPAAADKAADKTDGGSK